MIQALIILPKTSRYSPAKVGNFVWNETFQAHLYNGRPLDMAEFNEISNRIFFARRHEIEHYDLPPYVQLVDIAPEFAGPNAGTPISSTTTPPPQPESEPAEVSSLSPSLVRTRLKKRAPLPVPDLASALP